MRSLRAPLAGLPRPVKVLLLLVGVLTLPLAIMDAWGVHEAARLHGSWVGPALPEGSAPIVGSSPPPAGPRRHPGAGLEGSAPSPDPPGGGGSSPLDGAPLTGTVRAVCLLEGSPHPLTRAQREQAVKHLRVYLDSAEKVELGVSYFRRLLTPSQLDRLFFSPSGVALGHQGPEVLAGRIVDRILAMGIKPVSVKLEPSNRAPWEGDPIGHERDQRNGELRAVRMLEGMAQILDDPGAQLSRDQLGRVAGLFNEMHAPLTKGLEAELALRTMFTREQLALLPEWIDAVEHEQSLLEIFDLWLKASAAHGGEVTWEAPRSAPTAGWAGLNTVLMACVVLDQEGSLGASESQALRKAVGRLLESMDRLVRAVHQAVAILTPEQRVALYSSPAQRASEMAEVGSPGRALELLLVRLGQQASSKGVPIPDLSSVTFDSHTPPFFRMLEGLLYLVADPELQPTPQQARTLLEILEATHKDHSIHVQGPMFLRSFIPGERWERVKSGVIRLDHETDYTAATLLLLTFEHQLKADQLKADQLKARIKS